MPDDLESHIGSRVTLRTEGGELHGTIIGLLRRVPSPDPETAFNTTDFKLRLEDGSEIVAPGSSLTPAS